MRRSGDAIRSHATPITDALYGKKNRRAPKPDKARRNDHRTFTVGATLAPETFTALEQLKAELMKPKRRRRR